MEDQNVTVTDSGIESSIKAGSGEPTPQKAVRENVFTQEDVNKFLAKERRAWEKKAEEEKKALEDKYASTEGSLSELKKQLSTLQEEKNRIGKETEEAKAARLAAEAKVREVSARSELYNIALRMGVRPEAVADAVKLFDLPEKPEETEEKFGKFLENRPYLLKDQNGIKPNIGATNPGKGTGYDASNHPLVRKPSSSIFG